MATRCNCPKNCKNSSAVDEKSKTMRIANGITSALRRVVWKTHVTCSQLIHIGLAPRRSRGIPAVRGWVLRQYYRYLLAREGYAGNRSEAAPRGAKLWNPGNKLPGSACPGSRGHDFLNKCYKQQGPSDRDFFPTGPVVYCRAI